MCLLVEIQVFVGLAEIARLRARRRRSAMTSLKTMMRTPNIAFLLRYDCAFGGRLVEVAIETIPPRGQRAQLDRDLGIARDDSLDPKRLAFKLFWGRIEVADDQRDRRVGRSLKFGRLEPMVLDGRTELDRIRCL